MIDKITCFYCDHEYDEDTECAVCFKHTIEEVKTILPAYVVARMVAVTVVS